MTRPPATIFDRSVALERLGGEEFDVLVVGGGITGAGVALEASAGGLRTALVERAISPPAPRRSPPSSSTAVSATCSRRELGSSTRASWNDSACSTNAPIS